MARVERKSTRSVRCALAALFLAAALAGCGNPGEGSVSVSSESRARLLPRAGEFAQDATGAPVAKRALSSKELVRSRVAAESR